MQNNTIIRITSIAFFFLAAGIFTSVTILSGYQILFAIAAIYFTYLRFKSKDFKLPTSAWFLIAFSIVIALSIFVNIEVIPKPSRNFSKIKYFIFGVCGISVLKAWVLGTTSKVKNVLTNTFFVSIIAAALYGFTSLKDGRIAGLTDTMRYGYGSSIMLLALLSLILHQEKIKDWFNWKFATITFIIGFTGMYLTYTRGALLGFLCGLPLVLYYYKTKIGIIFGSLSILGVLTLGSFYLFGNGDYNSRFLINKNHESDIIRRSQWKAAFIATQEKPILGWGFSNFHSQLKRIKNQYDLDAKSYNDSHAHNLFLEISSGTGIIGLLIFIGWLLTWAKESYQAGGLTRAVVIPFGVAFVVTSQFEMTLSANSSSMIFFLYSLSFFTKDPAQ